MIKRLTILTLITLCLSGFTSVAYAQEGNPEEFEKKARQGENEEVDQQESDSSSSEAEEPGSLIPEKEIKTSSESIPPAQIGNQKNKKNDNSRVAPKVKETKSKYNILLYYFYKSKHEETETKESTSNRAS